MHQHEYNAYLHNLAEQLRKAGRGERGAILASAAGFLQCSPKTLYRDLKKITGYM